MSGLAFVIKGADFSSKNLGSVTPEEDVALTALSINCDDSISGQTKKLTASYTPSNTNQKNVVWSIESGSSYATIDESTGLLTILEGASNSEVVVKLESTDNTSISTTKTISVTYNDGITWYVKYTTANETAFAEHCMEQTAYNVKYCYWDTESDVKGSAIANAIAGKTINYLRMYIPAGKNVKYGKYDGTTYTTIGYLSNTGEANEFIEGSITPITLADGEFLLILFDDNTIMRQLNSLSNYTTTVYVGYVYHTAHYSGGTDSVMQMVSIGYKE